MARCTVRAVSLLLIGLGLVACGPEANGGDSGSGGAAGSVFAGEGGVSGGPAGGTGATGGAGGTSGTSGTGGATGGTGGGNPSNCVPDPTRYADEIRPILDQRCGGCHTTPTQFGAPFSVLDYDTVIAVMNGTRIVDRMVLQLGMGTMPPPGSIRPTPSEHDAIVDWASCGTNTPPYPTSLQASREVFEADAEPPATAQRVELTAENFSVPDGTVDHYESFLFSNVVSSDKFARRMDVSIDKSRVVHHITLHYAGASDTYLYAWAPGTGAVQFPDGGLRIRPSDQFRVEIHYNNVSGEGDVTDSSGVVMFVDEPVGTEYAMLDPNTFAIFVPAGSPGSAQANCTATSDFTILAGMPHMHEIGDSYSHTITRMGGATETIIELTGWSFDLQFFYELNTQVNTGDTMRITCNYLNDKDYTVTGGLGTTAEMCYDFIYVTPPSAGLNCN